MRVCEWGCEREGVCESVRVCVVCVRECVCVCVCVCVSESVGVSVSVCMCE